MGMTRRHDNSSDSRAIAVLPLSGGIESATLLSEESRHYRVRPLFLDYGQRAAAAELRAARALAKGLGLPLKVLSLASTGEGFRIGRERQAHVPLPHRNLALLSLTLSFASDLGAQRLAIGLNREDRDAYPSAGADFLEAFIRLSASLEQIEVTAPLYELDKAGVIARGLELGVDYASSYSCLLGHARQCGRCPQCEKRRAAFAANGMEDPAGFNH
jgi:7-cyano-7-deazaguanine synthase